MDVSNRSPLKLTVSERATDFWNDSCSIHELIYAIEHGAVGATTNPIIVKNLLQKEMHLWRDRIYEIIKENPTWSEIEVTWRVIEEAALEGAKKLEPIFSREKGRKGLLSIQTDPTNYRNAAEMVKQAVYFASLGPNLQVKLPVTQAGIHAIEEATYQGININGTVCFSVSQAVAVAEAVERGVKRREAEGLCDNNLVPVCTIMMGRIEDLVQAQAKREGIVSDPANFQWAGIATMKHAYRLYQARGYRTRLLAAAYRHHHHWSELIGGDLILTIPPKWQLWINASDIEVKARIQNEVNPEIVAELRSKFSEFRKAYDEEGLMAEDFVHFGATVRMLRDFISGYYELIELVRDFMLPNPTENR